MLTDTDCAARFATHARHVAHINEIEWMRPVVARAPHVQMRRWLATTLISLGTRLASSPAGEPPLPVLTGVSDGRVRGALRG